MDRTQPEAHVSEDISPHVKRQGGKDDEPTAKSDCPARSRCPTSTAGSGCPKPCDLGRGGGATLLMSTPTMATENQVLEWRPDSLSPPTGPPHYPEPLLCALLLPSLCGGPALPSPPPRRAWRAAGAQGVARGQPLPQQRATSVHPELAKTDHLSRTQPLRSTQGHANNSPFVLSPWVLILLKLHS